MATNTLDKLVRAWAAMDMATYNEILSAMTVYELQETASMLHMIARSMELRKADRIEEASL